MHSTREITRYPDSGAPSGGQRCGPRSRHPHHSVVTRAANVHSKREITWYSDSGAREHTLADPPHWEAKSVVPARDVLAIQSQLRRPVSIPHVKLHGIPIAGPPREARGVAPVRDILTIQSQLRRPMRIPQVKSRGFPIAGPVKTRWPTPFGRPGVRLPLETSSPFSRISGGQCPLHTRNYTVSR